MRRTSQAGQARERAIEALLTRIDIPLPDALVEHEIEHRRESLDGASFERQGLTMETYAESRQDLTRPTSRRRSPTRCGARCQGQVHPGPARRAGGTGHRAGRDRPVHHSAGLSAGGLARPVRPAADQLAASSARSSPTCCGPRPPSCSRSGRRSPTSPAARSTWAVTAEAVAAAKAEAATGPAWLTGKTGCAEDGPTWKTRPRGRCGRGAEVAEAEVARQMRPKKLPSRRGGRCRSGPCGRIR